MPRTDHGEDRRQTSRIQFSFYFDDQPIIIFYAHYKEFYGLSENVTRSNSDTLAAPIEAIVPLWLTV